RRPRRQPRGPHRSLSDNPSARRRFEVPDSLPGCGERFGYFPGHPVAPPGLKATGSVALRGSRGSPTAAADSAPARGGGPSPEGRLVSRGSSTAPRRLGLRITIGGVSPTMALWLRCQNRYRAPRLITVASRFRPPSRLYTWTTTHSTQATNPFIRPSPLT